MRHHFLTISAVVVTPILLIPCLPRLDQKLEALEKKASTHRPEHYSLPPAGVLRALSFGYNELSADFLWVRTIVYYADHLFGDRDTRHLERYIDTLLALDPHFKAVFRYGPSMLVSGSGKRVPEEIWAAIRLLKRAVRTYPDEWRYAFFLGSYYMTELHHGTPQERAVWRREGAEWIRRAALLDNSMSWLPALAAQVLTEQGQRDVAIQHLQELYVTTQDQQMRAQIAFKLKDLRAQKVLDEAKAADEALSRAQKESGLSFVPPDLFVLIWRQPAADYLH